MNSDLLETVDSDMMECVLKFLNVSLGTFSVEPKGCS